LLGGYKENHKKPLIWQPLSEPKFESWLAKCNARELTIQLQCLVCSIFWRTFVKCNVGTSVWDCRQINVAKSSFLNTKCVSFRKFIYSYIHTYLWNSDCICKYTLDSLTIKFKTELLEFLIHYLWINYALGHPV
jgi:hypothetical protein